MAPVIQLNPVARSRTEAEADAPLRAAPPTAVRQGDAAIGRHLGRHRQGPLTDVGAAAASLDAVRGLQRVLSDRLDVDRLVLPATRSENVRAS